VSSVTTNPFTNALRNEGHPATHLSAATQIAHGPHRSTKNSGSYPNWGSQSVRSGLQQPLTTPKGTKPTWSPVRQTSR